MNLLSITCPYCFEKINKKDVVFQCNNMALDVKGNKVCPKEIDPEYSQYLGITDSSRYLYREKVFKSGSKNPIMMPSSAICTCGYKSTRRLCPYCHNEFPNYFGEVDNLTIAVIGAKETGKSHYIAVLKKMLEENVGPAFSFTITAANDKTIQRYNSDFKKPIFEDKTIILSTKSAAVEHGVREPLIYSIVFYENKGGRKIRKKMITFSFFDTAGEDLNSEDVMSVVNKYIYNANGIICLLDPLQLKGVRDLVPEGTVLPEINTEIDDIIARVSNLIRNAKSVKGTGLRSSIDIPIAITFSKVDVLRKILPPSSQLHNLSPHCIDEVFNISDMENVSSEMEALIAKWSGVNLLTQVSSNFKDYKYFGVSALGCNPADSNQTINQVIPIRLEDPFLWILWKNKLITGR